MKAVILTAVALVAFLFWFFALFEMLSGQVKPLDAGKNLMILLGGMMVWGTALFDLITDHYDCD